MTALDWLEHVHDLCPSAARCALVSYGEGPTYPVVRHALVRGHVDSFLLKPLGNPEDRLYPVVAEILGSWSRSTQPSVPLVTIVGERWAPRSHELRDLLQRAGHTGAVPAVLFRDQCLENPSDGEVARMLGAGSHPVGGLYALVVIG